MESGSDFNSHKDKIGGLNQQPEDVDYTGLGNQALGNTIGLPDKYEEEPNDGPSPDDLPDGSRTGGPSTMPPARAAAPIPPPDTHLDLANSQL